MDNYVKGVKVIEIYDAANKELLVKYDDKPVCCMMDHCRNTRLMRLELWLFARLVISIWGC